MRVQHKAVLEDQAESAKESKLREIDDFQRQNELWNTMLSSSFLEFFRIFNRFQTFFSTIDVFSALYAARMLHFCFIFN